MGNTPRPECELCGRRRGNKIWYKSHDWKGWIHPECKEELLRRHLHKSVCPHCKQIFVNPSLAYRHAWKNKHWGDYNAYEGKGGGHDRQA